jgi:hypothetical protein
MIFIVEKDGDRIEVMGPKEIDDKFVIEQVDFEFKETSHYEFDDEEIAMMFLDAHLNSFKEDGYSVTKLEDELEDID